MTTLDEISALTKPHHPGDWSALDSRAVDTARVPSLIHLLRLRRSYAAISRGSRYQLYHIRYIKRTLTLKSQTKITAMYKKGRR